MINLVERIIASLVDPEYSWCVVHAVRLAQETGLNIAAEPRNTDGVFAVDHHVKNKLLGNPLELISYEVFIQQLDTLLNTPEMRCLMSCCALVILDYLINHQPDPNTLPDIHPFADDLDQEYSRLFWEKYREENGVLHPIIEIITVEQLLAKLLANEFFIFTRNILFESNGLPITDEDKLQFFQPQSHNQINEITSGIFLFLSNRRSLIDRCQTPWENVVKSLIGRLLKTKEGEKIKSGLTLTVYGSKVRDVKQLKRGSIHFPVGNLVIGITGVWDDNDPTSLEAIVDLNEKHVNLTRELIIHIREFLVTNGLTGFYELTIAPGLRNCFARIVLKETGKCDQEKLRLFFQSKNSHITPSVVLQEIVEDWLKKTGFTLTTEIQRESYN